MLSVANHTPMLLIVSIRPHTVQSFTNLPVSIMLLSFPKNVYANDGMSHSEVSYPVFISPRFEGRKVKATLVNL